MKKLILMLMLLAPIATFAQKFGIVNTQTIMQSLPEIKKVEGELQAAAMQYENDLKAMQEELQKQNEAYEKVKSTMNETARQQKEEELQGLYQKIQEQYQANQQELQKKQQELMAPIIAKVRQAIENVGKNGNFVFIFEEGTSIYTSATLVEDVTKLVQTEITRIK